MRIGVSLLVGLLVVCGVYVWYISAPDETISQYAGTQPVYYLVELNGASVSVTTTITFPEKGRVIGQGPCNSYSATQTVPYPWFALDGIISTRMACPDLVLEAAYFEALEGMTLAEVAGDTLILSDSEGRELVYKAR